MKSLKLALAFCQTAAITVGKNEFSLFSGRVLQNVTIKKCDRLDEWGGVWMSGKSITKNNNSGIRVINLLTWETVVDDSATTPPQWVVDKDISGSGIDPLVIEIIRAKQKHEKRNRQKGD